MRWLVVIFACEFLFGLIWLIVKFGRITIRDIMLFIGWGFVFFLMIWQGASSLSAVILYFILANLVIILFISYINTPGHYRDDK